MMSQPIMTESGSNLSPERPDSRMLSKDGGSFEKTLREKAHEAAEQFVASSLVIPILATLRANTFGAEGPFAPNMAEKRFGPVFDQQIADRVVQAANFPIVDMIADRYVEYMTGKPATEPAGQHIDFKG